MTHGYELVYPVLERFRGLPMRLASMTDKTDDWYRSHGYEPKTENPLKNGNLSAVDHYLRHVRLYEAGAKGAGKYLDTLVHHALQIEFAAGTDTSQGDLHESVITEHCDVNVWLAKFKISEATPVQLQSFEYECAEAIQAISDAMAKARAERRRREVKPLSAVGRGDD